VPLNHYCAVKFRPARFVCSEDGGAQHEMHPNGTFLRIQDTRGRFTVAKMSGAQWVIPISCPTQAEGQATALSANHTGQGGRRRSML
jgi:hypothetical protein